MALVTYANQPTTTVSNGGTDAPASGTSEQWTVSSSALFPTASTTSIPATYFCVADTASTSEIIGVTAITSNVWGVTRGFESTTPVTHATNFTVMQVITAGNLLNFKQASNAQTSPITVANSGTETVVATYDPLTGDIEAGVTFEAIAYGTYVTNNATLANRNMTWTVRWGGTGITGTVLCELVTNGNAPAMTTTSVAGSSFDVNATVVLTSTTQATTNINMWYTNSSNSLTATAANATVVNSTSGGASSPTPVTVSGNGPLFLTFKWGGTGTSTTMTAVAPVIYRAA